MQLVLTLRTRPGYRVVLVQLYWIDSYRKSTFLEQIFFIEFTFSISFSLSHSHYLGKFFSLIRASIDNDAWVYFPESWIVSNTLFYFLFAKIFNVPPNLYISSSYFSLSLSLSGVFIEARNIFSLEISNLNLLLEHTEGERERVSKREKKIDPIYTRRIPQQIPSSNGSKIFLPTKKGIL